MRTLAKYLQNYKKESVLAPFFKFLEVVFDLLVPVVIAQIIDVGIANNDHGYIVQKFFILILMAAAGLAVSITAQFFAAKASVGFATEVRQAVFDHIQKLSGFCQCHACPGPLKKLHLQLCFQLLDLIAQRRLGHVQSPCGFIDASCCCDLMKIFQLSDFHI